MMGNVYKVALILHKMPKEAMRLTINEMERLWSEHIDMVNEQMTGKRKTKLYEFERIALNDMRERFNGRS